jgi:dihydrofolate reductase
MRKVTFGCACSLDNFIAREDGAVDWLMWSDEAGQVMNEYWPKVDTIVMGRKTYDVAIQNQPKPKKKKKEAAANPYGDIRTYVFSRTLEAGERDGVVFTAEDPGKTIRRLKREKGKEICIMGGGDLGRSLLEAGVIDEIGLNIHPVLLGSGVPFFLPMKKQIGLELIECRPFKNGCVYVIYKVKR